MPVNGRMLVEEPLFDIGSAQLDARGAECARYFVRCVI